MNRRYCFALIALLAFASAAGAQRAPAAKKAAGAKPPPPPAYLEAAKAGPDFVVQGEYEGAAGAAKLGCQVMALGGSTFKAVFLPGGLPGAGWDGKTRIELDGKGDGGDKAVFAGGEGKYTASVADAVMVGKTDKGEGFLLKKVIRKSPTLGEKAPAGALVLFDGTGGDKWTIPAGREAEFLITREGEKVLCTGAGTIKTKQLFGDFKLHLEFMTPFKPAGRGQDRGNSGVYIQDRYEVQVLDSFGLPGAANECAAMYTQKKPDVHMAFPPLSWQTYDIDFTAAKFDTDGKKTAPATITVKHNGVVVQDKYEFPKQTGAGQKEAATPGPIQFQGHGNPVMFRNIWIVEKK